jgi:hypothetical protein
MGLCPAILRLNALAGVDTYFCGLPEGHEGAHSAPFAVLRNPPELYLPPSPDCARWQVTEAHVELHWH